VPEDGHPLARHQQVGEAQNILDNDLCPTVSVAHGL
jgi:hypothetical protein